MSFEYDQYLRRHKANVQKGLDWLKENLPEVLEKAEHLDWQIGIAHDQSKSDPEEYAAYDAYFYGRNRSYACVQNFRRAWLRHIHLNPHHWQHWVLINDDPKDGEICLEMPYNYIIEMICDWWSFSWNGGNLDEIFDWYNEHREHMKLEERTRERVEDILRKMLLKLSETGTDDQELMHYGIKGMKWGVRRTPEELKYNKGSVGTTVNRYLRYNVRTRDGLRVNSISDHAAGGVSARDILDATERSLYIRPKKADAQGRTSIQYLGKKATVCINPESGVITTVWRTGTEKSRKYMKGRG